MVTGFKCIWIQRSSRPGVWLHGTELHTFGAGVYRVSLLTHQMILAGVNLCIFIDHSCA